MRFPKLFEVFLVQIKKKSHYKIFIRGQKRKVGGRKEI
jgi:hypothetical protein